jgi:hypothetical protein
MPRDDCAGFSVSDVFFGGIRPQPLRVLPDRDVRLRNATFVLPNRNVSPGQFPGDRSIGQARLWICSYDRSASAMMNGA